MDSVYGHELLAINFNLRIDETISETFRRHGSVHEWATFFCKCRLILYVLIITRTKKDINCVHFIDQTIIKIWQLMMLSFIYEFLPIERNKTAADCNIDILFFPKHLFLYVTNFCDIINKFERCLICSKLVRKKKKEEEEFDWEHKSTIVSFPYFCCK